MAAASRVCTDTYIWRFTCGACACACAPARAIMHMHHAHVQHGRARARARACAWMCMQHAHAHDIGVCICMHTRKSQFSFETIFEVKLCAEAPTLVLPPARATPALRTTFLGAAFLTTFFTTFFGATFFTTCAAWAGVGEAWVRVGGRGRSVGGWAWRAALGRRCSGLSVCEAWAAWAAWARAHLLDDLLRRHLLDDLVRWAVDGG